MWISEGYTNILRLQKSVKAVFLSGSRTARYEEAYDRVRKLGLIQSQTLHISVVQDGALILSVCSCVSAVNVSTSIFEISIKNNMGLVPAGRQQQRTSLFIMVISRRFV